MTLLHLKWKAFTVWPCQLDPVLFSTEKYLWPTTPRSLLNCWICKCLMCLWIKSEIFNWWIFQAIFLDLVSSGCRDPVSYCSSRVQSAPTFIPGLRRVSTDMEVPNSKSTGVSLPVREIMRRLACHTISDIEVISVVIQDIIFWYYNVQQNWKNFLPSVLRRTLLGLLAPKMRTFSIHDEVMKLQSGHRLLRWRKVWSESKLLVQNWIKNVWTMKHISKEQININTWRWEHCWQKWGSDE